MAEKVEVLIAGAGPTGLTLALWLQKLGVRFRIIDRLPAPAPYSRALGVQTRTLELYRQLGDLGDAVAARGLHVEGIHFWTGGHGRAHIRLGDIGRGLTPFPFVLTYAQDAHERLLLDRLAAAGVEVERATELVRYEQTGRGIRAMLRRDGAESVCEAAYLAGCDGAHSAVRAGMQIEFAGGTYSRLFYVADVDASGPVIGRDIHVDLDEADLLAIFPMTAEGRVRLVGTIRDDAAANGRTPEFSDVSPRAIDSLHLAVNRVHWFSTYRVHHRVATRFRDRGAFLLGDAAHVHSPVGAQGMNTGIGDAVNLAWKLAAVLRDGAPERLLDTYDAERRAFARRLVRTTDRIFTFASQPGSLARIVRTMVVPVVAPMLFRLPAMRRYLFRTVSQLVVHYRGNAISRGRAGRVHGGDRLPWVPLDDGDNLTFVSSLRWQVHVYGEARGDLAAACAELGLALHRFPWTPAAKRAGLARDAVYLVRPDSYVGFADPSADPAALRAYAKELNLRG